MKTETSKLNSLILEKNIVATMLSEPDQIQAVRNEGLKSSDFTDTLCQKLFDRIMDHGELDEAMIMTSMPELSSDIMTLLVKNTVASPCVAQWCRTLKDFTARRKAIASCQAVIENALDTQSLFMNELKNSIAGLLEQQNRLEVRRGKSIDELRKDFYDSIDPVKSTENIILYGLPTDNLMKHRRGEVFTLGAAPGTGKTSFALTVMLNVLENNRKVALFCQEMPTSVLIQRLVSNLADVPFDDLGKPEMREKTEEAFAVLLKLIEKHRLLICGCGEYTHSASGIEAELQRFYNEAGGVDLFVLDYVQSLTATGKAKDRRERMDEDLEAIKNLAVRLNCGCLLLSQLSRNGQQGALTLAS